MLSMVLVFCAATAITSAAQTFTTLTSFGGANGNGPTAALIQGVDGSFYGTTINGGTGMGSDQCLPPYGGCGTVFKVTPSGTITSLYSFCSQLNCSDGSFSHAALVRGADGDYYGTTQNGGAGCPQMGCGTVFKVTPSGTLTTLYNFCSRPNCPDGYGPEAGLVLASDGNFYGTTQGGGAHFYGTVFKLTPSGTLTTLYNFCSLANCADGSQPIGGLIQAADGNLYGTTAVGGMLGLGTVFRITLNGVLTTLYSFNGHYGSAPLAALVQASDGNFYGTTQSGGGNYCSPDGCGTVFKITPSGALTTLHSFSGSDGGLAIAGLLQATDGNFYGTTWNGGANGLGTVFKITMGGTLTTLHDFTGMDGGAQEGTLLQATDGTVYGTAGQGGTNYFGTVFTLTLPLQFVPVAPCRLVDTRPEHGGGGPIPGGTFQNFPIQQEGNCNIPATAAAYSLNVSVVPLGPLGFLTVWPAGQPQPLASTLNSLDGRIKANAAIVLAGTNGDVSVYASNTTNVILDVNGYFAPVSSSTLAFYPLTPCRVADTRKSTFPSGLGPPSLTGGQERDFPILNATTCNIPSTAVAYSLNFAVVPPGPLGYMTVWPTGEPRPTVSTLNDIPGQIVANAAIVAAGTGSQVAVYPTNDTDVVIDINGYFAAAGTGGLSLYGVSPCRVIDTRKIGSGQPFNGTLSPPVDVVDAGCAASSLAQAYVFNASVVPYGSLGYLTLWPDGTSQPLVSTLNALDGSISSNMAIVPSTNGKVDAYASGITQLILDISSYFAP
jgi:uncharacterized repeat protein (TIGR03803 family)